MRIRSLLLLLVSTGGLSAAVLTSCVSDTPVGPDGSTPDGAVPDTATGDSTTTDGSMTDSATGDAGDGGGGGCITDSGAKSGSIDMVGFANGVKSALDPTFVPQALAIDNMQRIWVAGYADCNTNGSYRMAVFRFLSDGTVDPMFGKPLCIDFGNDSSRRSFGYGITVDSAGHVLVGGNETTGSGLGSVSHFALAKISGNFLDQGFGMQGKLTNLNLGGISAVVADGEQPVVSGVSVGGFLGSGGFIQRLLKDGSLDSTFNNGGAPVIDDKSDGGNYPTMVGNYETCAVDPTTHAIYVAGTTINPSNYLVRKFKANGQRDMAFNNGASVITSTSSGSDWALSLGITQSSARLAGTANGGGAVTGYNQSGLDMSFGTNGIQSITTNENENFSREILAVQCDNNFVVAGFNSGLNDMSIARLKPNGQFDTTFATNGLGTLGIMGSTEVPIAVRQDPISGKLIVLGRRTDQTNMGTVVLVRVNQ